MSTRREREEESVSESTMAEPTFMMGGIPLAPKDHLCVFFRGRREHDRLVFPFVRAGLESGQVCYVVVPAGESAGFAAAVAGEASRKSVDPNLLQLAEPEGFYLKDGEFQPGAVVESLHAWSRTTFDERGAEFARVASDMSWAGPLVEPAFVDELIRYEATATEWARTYPQVVVCFYDLDVFGGDVVIPIIKTHTKVWMGGAVVENPYVLPASSAGTAPGR
jgi:hypothetical protein